MERFLLGSDKTQNRMGQRTEGVEGAGKTFSPGMLKSNHLLIIDCLV